MGFPAAGSATGAGIDASAAIDVTVPLAGDVHLARVLLIGAAVQPNKVPAESSNPPIRNSARIR